MLRPEPPAARTPSREDTARRHQEQLLGEAQHAATFHRFRQVMLVGALIWPSFAIADLLTLDTFGRQVPASGILGPRFFFAGVGALACVWLYRRKTLSLRAMVIMDQALYTQANLWIGVMGLQLDGLRSPYLVGACLVLSARMFTLPFHWSRALALNVLPAAAAPVTCLVGVALSPGLRWQLTDPDSLALFALTIAYLAGTAIIMSAGSHLIHDLRSQLSAERDIGKYRLRHRLGMGGMGEVWAAWHSRLKRDVALKILRPGHRDDVASTRFEREVQATSELAHPNTVRVFDFGTTEDGLLYYAMELLQGEDLGALITREGVLPPARAVYLVSQAARALSEAHARGIVHRDVKPENLFVTSAGGEGDFIKVLDFGIARVEREGGAEELRLTSNDAVVGSPQYMAPEAMRGGTATPRSDVYGLGCVLNLALTGRHPFQATSKAELFAAVLSDTEAPPVTRPDVSPALAAVVARALAKDPAARCANAEALSDALRAVPEASQWVPSRVAVGHAPQSGAPTGPPEGAARPGAASATDTQTSELPLERR